jgi:hypothetical protein
MKISEPSVSHARCLGRGGSMSKLAPDDPSIAASGSDPGRRKSVAQEARGARTFAVTSAPAATPIPLGAGESQFLRVWRLQPSEPFVENLKLGTA